MADALKNVIAQSLECPVCLDTFTDPKILSCSHTYCKACLDNLLECHGNDQMLRCPVCRAETQVPNRDVSKLPASLALKSLIEDVKNHRQFCSNCKSEDKPQAAVYCQDCGKYLCFTCHNNHSQWQDFISHEVLPMSEIVSGKVSVRIDTVNAGNTPKRMRSASVPTAGDLPASDVLSWNIQRKDMGSLRQLFMKAAI
ncbi:tripartite motif-containing protein 59-like [Strongylocentrotus purpuratus]|uniref:Uncharacterized protein n=1 Tax=Strongylocentrotus purpuratus TaxID=7668 RepID=A0A7M7HM27_STRPU|nr:tripartite motif-containing protein 59-like [Strongylocentrotus purpuratus]